jgi:hypothetical protein
VEHGVFLAGLASGEERSAGTPQWRRHRPGGEQVGQRRGEAVAAGEGIEMLSGQLVLRG